MYAPAPAWMHSSRFDLQQRAPSLAIVKVELTNTFVTSVGRAFASVPDREAFLSQDGQSSAFAESGRRRRSNKIAR